MRGSKFPPGNASSKNSVLTKKYPEGVGDDEDGAERYEDDGQVHLPVVVGRVDVDAGVQNSPERGNCHRNNRVV